MAPPLEDLTNARERHRAPQGKRGAAPAAAGPTTAATVPPPTAPPPDTDALLASLRSKLTLLDSAEALGSPRDSAASTASRTAPTTAASSACSSLLSSPMAAFAAAKARLARSNSDADSLISSTLSTMPLSTLRPMGSAPPPAPDGATSAFAAAAASSSALVTPRRSRSASVSGSPARLSRAGSSGSSSLVAVAALQQRTLRLKERLSSTMSLCHVLHEQNRESMERVAQLWSDNQRLSRSLQDARLDKDGLQKTIRQLTVEAALLAEQARRALMPPSAAASPRLQGVAEDWEAETEAGTEVGEAEAEAEEGPAREGPAQSQPAAAAMPVSPAVSVAAPRDAGKAPAVAGSAPAAFRGIPGSFGVGLAEDWSQAASVASSGSGRLQQGAAWQPATSVRSFQCGSSLGSAADGRPSQPAAQAAYVQGPSGPAAGDKRRRLEPGLLAHCLRPAAVAEEDEEEEGEAASTPRGRSHTPIKRKAQRGLDSSRVSTPRGPPAPDPAEEPAAAPTATLQHSPAAPAEQAAGRREVAGCEATAPPAGALQDRQQQRGLAEAVDEEYEWRTFALFDSMWFGGGGASAGRQGRGLLTAGRA